VAFFWHFVAFGGFLWRFVVFSAAGLDQLHLTVIFLEPSFTCPLSYQLKIIVDKNRGQLISAAPLSQKKIFFLLSSCTLFCLSTGNVLRVVLSGIKCGVLIQLGGKTQKYGTSGTQILIE
jgi:hypothetical protein